MCIRTAINKLWVTWAWHGIYEKIIFTPLKQPPCRKSGTCTKTFIWCIPFKGQERKLRRWVIAKMILKMCSYLLDRGNVKKAGRWAKAGSGKMQIPGPSRRQMLRKEFHLLLPSEECCAVFSQQQRYPGEERVMCCLSHQFFARVGIGRKKRLFNKHLTWHLDFPVLVSTVLLNPKSTFLFRHEFWSGRYFSDQHSFLLTSADLSRFFY